MTLTVYPEGVKKSGTGGGTVHSHCRYGSYTRNRSYPVNPNTVRQSQMKAILAALSIAWNESLTDNQRKSWLKYAANISWKNRLAQTVNLTGFTHFVRSNAPRLQAGVPRIDAGPFTYNLAVPEQDMSIDNNIGLDTIIVTYDNVGPAWAAEAGAYQIFWQGRPTSSSQKFFGGPWRYLGNIAGLAPGPPASPTLFSTEFPYALGQLLRVRSRISRADGRLSEFAYAEIITT